MTNSATMVLFRTLLAIALLFSGLGLLTAPFGHAAGEQGAKGLVSGPMMGNPEISQKLELAEFNRQFRHQVEKKVEQLRRHELFQQKMFQYPAGEKMAAFFRALENARAEGFDTTTLMASLSKNDISLFKGEVAGDLSGTVTVEGSVDPFGSIDVSVFDVHGFFVRSTTVDASTGGYLISDLHPGDYYVITHSGFVDEFYDDVIFDFAQNWRQATLVNIPDTGAATGIDFDLQRGATISGTIFREDGTTPIANSSASFLVFDASNPDRSLSIFAATDANGAYQIDVPITGAVKILASVFGFRDEFYNNRSDFLTADEINIASLDDDIQGIDFSLAAIDAPEGIDRGAIHGSVLGPASAPVPFAFVFAFDVADTSIAGITISGFTGAYQLPLDDGEYILYANQFLDFLPTGPSVQGEYFDNADTPDAATSVTVANMDTVDGINFNLDIGGAISGNITDSNSTPLDSILVLAIRFDHENGDGFFADDLDIGLAFSSEDGNYTIPGLGGGEFVLRTVSLISSTAGPVIDEYYVDVQSLFEFDEATPVTVSPPATTENIDFELEIGGFISGGFFEADGTTPVEGEGTVLVFDEAGLPVLAVSEFDPQSSTYEVGPLGSGSYRLLGAVSSFSGPPDGNAASTTAVSGSGLAGLSDPPVLEDHDLVIYLPQFYDQKASLEEADEVVVASPNTTADIDFQMIRASAIQGFVLQPNGQAIGADFLATTSVLLYHAQTGEAVSGSDVTFSGGYRFIGVPPGQYKVAALTATQGYAGTYHGGGATFDDVNSTTVALAPGEVQDADITLASANGIISGTVFSAESSAPVSGVLVLAYDATGHVLSAGLSGFNFDTGVPITPGRYEIPGLRDGDYFVRTFSLFRLAIAVDAIGPSGGAGGDLLASIFGLLASGPDIVSSAQEFELYGDVWYTNVPILVDLEDPNLFLTLIGLLLGNRQFESLIPFFDEVPATATDVTVSGGATVNNIDLFLPALSDVLTSVEDDLTTRLPETFQLEQNYPNPFNPSTVINYSIPEIANVRLRVYNVLGQRIRTLFDGRREPGTYSVQWDGLNDRGAQVAGGIYFFRLETDDRVLARKMLLVR